MKNLGRVFGNFIIGEFFCTDSCDFQILPRRLEKDQDKFTWVKVNRQDDVVGTMLMPLCPKCGKRLIYDEST